jgi:hypothetical protein
VNGSGEKSTVVNVQGGVPFWKRRGYERIIIPEKYPRLRHFREARILKKRGRILIAGGMTAILIFVILSIVYYQFWRHVGFILSAIPLFIIVLGLLISAIINNDILFRISVGIIGVFLLCFGVFFLYLVISNGGTGNIYLVIIVAVLMVLYGILISAFSFRKALESRAKKSE